MGGGARNLKWGFVAVVALVVGGCGSSQRAHTTTSRTVTSSRSAAAPAPLALPARRRVAALCRRAETSEDRNVILDLANEGMRIAAPSVFKAARHASADVAREARALGATRSGPAATMGELSQEVRLEARILDQMSRVQPAAAHALLTTLRQRIATARAAKVSACAGVSPVSALKPA